MNTDTNPVPSINPSKVKSKEPNWWLGKWERSFLGKVKDFDSKEERDKEQRHLRAYIKGKTRYWDGTYIDAINPLTRRIEKTKNFVEVKQTLNKLT